MCQTRGDRGPCGCCAGFIVSAGITALILWLTYRRIAPRYYLLSFSLSSPPGYNLTASYLLQVENKNWNMGVYHDDILLSLSPGGNLTSSIPAFYQGHKKTSEKSGNFTTSGKYSTVPKNGTKAFRVGVESGYRLKVWWWKTKHRTVSLACDVRVDGEGKKTEEKGIRLTSAGERIRAATTLVVNLLALLVVAGILL